MNLLLFLFHSFLVLIDLLSPPLQVKHLPVVLDGEHLVMKRLQLLVLLDDSASVRAGLDRFLLADLGR